MTNRTWLSGLFVVLGFLTFADASPIFLPLSAVVPGTGNFTLVPNGGFESPGGFTTNPPNWARVFTAYVFTASNIDADGFRPLVTTADETQIAMGDTNGGGGTFNVSSGYSQSLISVTSGANYVFSLYMWNFSNFGSGAFPSLGTAPVHAQVFDSTGATELADITILPTDPTDGPPGYFAYVPFTNLGGNTTVTVKVLYDGYAGPGGEQIISAWDNVAITPLASFVAPTAPEPASAGILLVSGLVLIGARRRR